MPNYRTGDIVELSLFQNLSEGKYNTFKGMVIGRSKINNVRQDLHFHTVAESEQTTIKIKVNGPMLAKLEILKMGSNSNRKKINHIPALNLTEKQLLEPIVHGRGYKARTDPSDPKKKAQTKRSEA